MLEIKDINKNFGGLRAVNNASMKIEKGSITGLIGPNGAGKTTLFNTIAGVYTPDKGEIFLENQNITGLKPHNLFNKGILRTFQIAHEFSTLTVLENLMMVPPNQYGENLIYAWFRNNDVKKQEEEIRTKAIEVIEFLNLNHLTQELAGNLSGGQKKLLELGRTMMVDSKLVLLDEVGAGVNRTLLNDISDAILRLNKEKNYTFFVIEHDMDLIEKICDPVIVMAEGSVLFEGKFDEVKSNEEVIEAYLGRGLKVKNTQND
ncbi:ABC transporter ATP-binding protein [Alphaproteobacteria bacterium]|nr:ABC transporter ATP-binding protein [Alphaproteobacteria bacterium]